ncbi:MAG: ABC transporter ATP-binding protein [Rhodoferax sp.]
MLELRGIHKSWPASAGEPRHLLRDVCLAVAPGQTVALLGASGSGKSTLLRIIAGVERADAGQVLWDGRSLDGVAIERRGVGLVFQDYALFPHLDVVDNVAFGLVEHGMRRSPARAQAQALLLRFGLAFAPGQRVWQLSGGEQQRVALARSLIVQPRVLLLDEPLSAVDAGLRAQLRQEFAGRIASAGSAALWVTHDEAEARAVAQRAYALDAGALRPLW